MTPFVASAILEQLAQSLAQTIWNRPELSQPRPWDAVFTRDDLGRMFMDDEAQLGPFFNDGPLPCP